MFIHLKIDIFMYICLHLHHKTIQDKHDMVDQHRLLTRQLDSPGTQSAKIRVPSLKRSLQTYTNENDG